MDVSQAAASDATSAILGSIWQALSENDRVTVTEFGTFSVKERAARQIRAKTGENADQMIDGSARKYFALNAGIAFE